MSVQRNFGLDLLRAAAITGVFLGHTAYLPRLTMGLDLFFVLSGFLIGRIYFRSRQDGSFKLSGFWISRWWRTLPPYLAALLIYAVCAHFSIGRPLRWDYLLFLQNFNMKSGLGFTQSWSLCVEEHFYLLLPLFGGLAVMVFGKKSFAWLLPIAFLLPSGLMVWQLHRFGGLANAPVPAFWAWQTPFASQGLIAGVAMAYLFVEQPGLFQRFRPMALCLAVALLPMFLYLEGHQNYWLMCSAGAFRAIGFAALLRITYDLKWEPSSAIGRWTKSAVRATAITSYSVYLMHDLLSRDTIVLARTPIKPLLVILMMLAPCIPFYFLFERPSILTRDRYMKRHVRVHPDTVPASTPLQTS